MLAKSTEFPVSVCFEKKLSASEKYFENRVQQLLH